MPQCRLSTHLCWPWLTQCNQRLMPRWLCWRVGVDLSFIGVCVYVYIHTHTHTQTHIHTHNPHTYTYTHTHTHNTHTYIHINTHTHIHRYTPVGRRVGVGVCVGEGLSTLLHKHKTNTLTLSTLRDLLVVSWDLREEERVVYNVYKIKRRKNYLPNYFICYLSRI